MHWFLAPAQAKIKSEYLVEESRSVLFLVSCQGWKFLCRHLLAVAVVILRVRRQGGKHAKENLFIKTLVLKYPRTRWLSHSCTEASPRLQHTALCGSGCVWNTSYSWLSLRSIVSLITVMMLMLCHGMCHVMVRHANARLAFLSFAPSSVFIKWLSWSLHNSGGQAAIGWCAAAGHDSGKNCVTWTFPSLEAGSSEGVVGMALCLRVCVSICRFNKKGSF